VVIRLDGPDSPQDMPPGWATLPMLDEAIHQAAQRVIVPAGVGSTVLRWDDQLDVQPVYVSTALGGMTDQRVAAYVAKYATKGAESDGTVDRPIRNSWGITGLDVTEHARRMIWTCFAPTDLPEFRDLPYAGGRTCSATEDTSRPRAAATRPHLARSGRHAPTTVRQRLMSTADIFAAAPRAGRPRQHRPVGRRPL
jgi:Replication initiator protein, pSAM2